MPESDRIVSLNAVERRDAFLSSRIKLTDFLITYTLFESYRNFVTHNRPFPFIGTDRILPGMAQPSIEHPYQNTALILLLDGHLPRGLNKHFRLRASNKVTWRNIQRLAPDIDLTNYKAAHCQLGSAEVDGLLRQLSRLDYALLVERELTSGDEDPPCALTHMHVKVERLTDNAIRDLGRKLGYLDRSLFERGEDYAEALEAKYFEYYGFATNASGRKSAAAMACQLLGQHLSRFNVFLSSQEDCRLTILDESDIVTQYLLIRLDQPALERLHAACVVAGLGKPERFIAFYDRESGHPVVLYRVRLRRTAAASAGERQERDHGLTTAWLEISDEAVILPPGELRQEVPFAWAAETD